MRLKALEKLKLKPEEKLASHTTFRIGGMPDYFFIAGGIRELADINDFLSSYKGKRYILGGGSNILAADDLHGCSIIKLNFNFLKNLGGGVIKAGASVTISQLLNYCMRCSYGGFENFAGIPATVGGALAMNLSSFGISLSEYVLEVEILKKGRVYIIPKNQIKFFYRRSSLQEGVIISATFKLPQSDTQKIKAKIKSYFSKKKDTQELFLPSAGCIFKNPPHKSAGFLIAQSGCGGLKKNGAAVSLKHANFIVNYGGASAADVDFLIREVKKIVYGRFGILLEEEIIRWGPDN